MEESIKLCTHEKDFFRRQKFIALQLSLGFSKALQEDSSNSLPLASVPNDYALHLHMQALEPIDACNASTFVLK